jgi:hypothetical protein
VRVVIERLFGFHRVVQYFRDPRYTGENRYFPCTLLNLAVATAVSVVVSAFTPQLGFLLFGGSLATIYLRGYVVPGTRTLTERYRSDRGIERLGVYPFPDVYSDDDTRTTHTDSNADLVYEDVATVEAFLRRHGALVERNGGLRLHPEFRAAWRDRMAGIEDSETLLEVAGHYVFDSHAASTPLSLARRDGRVVVSVDGRAVARWISWPAAVSDVGAAAKLADRSDRWETFDWDVRLRILGTLRLWLGRCPSCGDSVTFERAVTEASGRSVPAVVATCDGCGARLLETAHGVGSHHS